MESPVFEQIDPASDCDCPGCVHWRRALPRSRTGRITAHPAARRALALAAMASAALGASHAVPAVAVPPVSHRSGVSAGDERDTPQGDTAPLHGPDARRDQPSTSSEPVAITRAEIISRARTWVAAKVPYSMNKYWSDGYRQDCSGYVSMAWKLPGNEWTGSLAQYAERISKEELQPGDILLFHNPANAQSGSHVTIFGGWTNSARTSYTAYEQARPHTRRKATPYAYWTDSHRYVPYRYKGITQEPAQGPDSGSGSGTDSGAHSGPAAGPDSGSGSGTGPGAEPGPASGADNPGPGPGAVSGPASGAAPGAVSGAASGPAPGSDRGLPGAPAAATPYPGAVYFGPGANNGYVLRLGRMLVARGAGAAYRSGPGPRWSDAHRRATRAFQRAQGWKGADADGLPGPRTWDLLVTGRGKDVKAGAVGTRPSSHDVPGYPGRAMFRPGEANPHITRMRRQLVRKGFGRFYTAEPGPRWSEADRRAVEAFQRTQGWRGGAADGFPGPETWRRLFS
ncbi:membrane protein [Streptomyces viridochromogenes DSM 40736]|uniref:Membrane protein n=1 Tax=Streptomyces viridochromogenes (strain DSM 40736 / JCM 4977 / BCRC 1201 / Tue 494) TaxID=591159 RepID=D9XCB5_STRVT|nr:peptidoglycan-binding protein [Streptomyces viridochromogenes]EFL32372.1 membrane protein [Streptomyces viridochromogenes DSM 40736]